MPPPVDTLRDLPDMEALEDAGLLSKEKALAGDTPIAGDDPDSRGNLAAAGDEDAE